MTRTRSLLTITAISAGVLAAILMMNTEAPKPQVVERVVQPVQNAGILTSEILVAARELPMGSTVKPGDFIWKAWPKDAVSQSSVRRESMADAAEKMKGSILRQALVAGEPVNAARLVPADGGGFMAAILPAGMRAASIVITPESSAGGFVLPNDRVDVILSRRRTGQQANSNAPQVISETILTNVRVLAIDQAAQEKDGQRSVLGRTATLELQPKQAESLAMARDMGTLSLALRSMSDRNEEAGVIKDEAVSSMTVVKFGNPSRVQVNNNSNNGKTQ